MSGDQSDRPHEAPEPGPDSEFPGPRVLIALAVVAAVAGALTGVVGGAFRWLLVRAEDWRSTVLDWSHSHGALGVAAVIGLSAVCAGAAVWIVQWVPLAGGSGIQQVEAVEDKQSAAAPWTVVPARFFGGLLSMGAGGMVLGREGPTVHMGAAIGAAAGRLVRASADEIRVMQTAMAGAGLAVAFNAPIGGALFTFEEVAKKIRLRYAVWTLAAVATAVVFSRMILGDHPDFRAGGIDNPSPSRLWIFLVFGVLVGGLGVLYSRAVMWAVDLFGRIRLSPVPIGAGVGAVIGVLALTVPEAVGGGDALAQRMLDGQRLALWTLIGFLALRMLTGPLSYGIGAPGGLFAPMLALGALSGVIFGRLLEVFDESLYAELTPALIIVGMSTLFAAVVRVPLTAVVLVIEMTAVTALTVPMIVAVTASVVTASLAGSAPVYDSLRTRMLHSYLEDPLHRRR
ncbi:ClC family H(+)/Cl(-) exchange transporter [Gordonia sp. (in: high G+C Gram-positive bacteria)]|uniref:ClC family H(+)/Cl(-) exchange transporter n=1 Tax=Gordonia sp. (in: high G+C Gram-positive bacteria) TaxID=84139 RepID=UPI003C70F81D